MNSSVRRSRRIQTHEQIPVLHTSMPGRCCFLNRQNEFGGALAITAAALGIDFVSGRALAAFYAQMGRMSWLGIGFSVLLFGAAIGFFARLARRSGTRCIWDLLRRLPGGGMGRGTFFLYAGVVLLGAGMLMKSAGHMGALMLPLRRAELLSAALALALAGFLAFTGEHSIRMLGGLLAMAMLGFEGLLLLSGEPAEALHYAVELHLKDSWVAALGFALLHTAVCLCMAVGVTVRLSKGRMRPGRLGSLSGAFYGLQLALGNAVFMARDEQILALRFPFVALSADWGSAGFYLSAGLGWLFCMFSLAGLIYGVLPGGSGAKLRGK